MSRLSSPLTELESAYDAVVVGSGYGGAIAASRLSRVRTGTGRGGGRLSVCVLERGLERQPGEYPRTLGGALGQFRIEHRLLRLGAGTGLYDLRVGRDMSVFMGCGLGGTSLINAGVMLRPRQWVLEDARWPDALRDDGELERGFERSKRMLDSRRYPSARPPLPKLLALERAGSGEGPGAMVRTPITVSFRTGRNEFGVQERACVDCGDCMTGCNHGAKRTLITNYLPDAVNHGAKIFCGLAVRAVEPRPNGDWIVHFHPVDRGWARFRPPEMFVHARVVVLAAGSLGSTEILLRSRERGYIRGSPKLGESFSGNGDTLAFAYNGDRPVDGVGFGPGTPGEHPPVGPTIAGVLDERGTRRKRKREIVIQEGTIPGALAPILGPTFFLAARWSRRDPGHSLRARLRELGRELTSVLGGARRGAVRNTLTFLTMGHERSTGVLRLDRDRIRIVWKGIGREAVFSDVAARLGRASRRLGGTHVVNPIWRRALGRRLVTVHPLGGCPMGSSAERGVVDHEGRVFRDPEGEAAHENLYVADGSVVRRSLGVNPLWTISAIAERMCVLLARRRRWRIAGIDDGQGARGYAPPVRASTPGPPRPGVRFSERMKGVLRTARGANEDDVSSFGFTVTIISDDLEALIRDGRHEAVILGTARAPSLSSKPLTITEGRFRLFEVDARRVDTLLMRYRMKLTNRDGQTFRLSGLKRLHDQPWRLDAWSDLTRMAFTLWEEREDCCVRVGEGEVRIRLRDMGRLLAGITPTGVEGRMARWGQKFRFAAHFARNLFRVYGWPFAPADVIDPLQPLPHDRVPGSGAPERHTLVTADGAEIHLERHRRGEEGPPVILAPGFGTSTLAFALPTLRMNLTTYLEARGFDVWLLDYRVSERSASAGTQFTLDDIARYDWPEAVEHVHAVTGRPVHLLGHCVASLTLLMSLLEGSLDQDKVRSVLCSQSFTHVEQSWANRLKARLRLASIVGGLGFWPTLNPSYDLHAPLGQRVADILLRLYPTSERCRNPVCRRILFLYGEVFLHERLDQATHRAVYDMFNRANLTTFRHLARIVRAGRIVDAEGRDRYVRPENAARIHVPVTLLQGKRNPIFRRGGGRRSLAWLQEHGRTGGDGGRLFRMREEEFRDYGHMDLFIGRRAWKDVYPVIAEEIERGEALGKPEPSLRPAAPAG